MRLFIILICDFRFNTRILSRARFPVFLFFVNNAFNKNTILVKIFRTVAGKTTSTYKNNINNINYQCVIKSVV